MNSTINNEWVKIAQGIIETKERIKLLEEQEKVLMNCLVRISNEQPRQIDMFNLKRAERKGSVDYNCIPVLRGIDLEQYRKASISYWKLELRRNNNEIA